MSFFDMSQGGWDGWRFGKWGKAKVWRLIAPNEETFQAGDILALRQLVGETDFLRLRVKQLQTISRPALSTDDLAALETAITVLQGFITIFTAAGCYAVNRGRRPHRAFNLAGLDKTVFGEGLHNKVANDVRDMD